ncbi:unnamed protein product [Somion occarium]|uniref:Uncharacterized protein n=1 Tax=Somion occarium TaxID=3059160 RepID=A0ABP1DDI9_9APHY
MGVSDASSSEGSSLLGDRSGGAPVVAGAWSARPSSTPAMVAVGSPQPLPPPVVDTMSLARASSLFGLLRGFHGAPHPDRLLSTTGTCSFSLPLPVSFSASRQPEGLPHPPVFVAGNGSPQPADVPHPDAEPHPESFSGGTPQPKSISGGAPQPPESLLAEVPPAKRMG